MEDRSNKKHSLSLVEREKMTLSGIKEVFSFDEQLIELETSKGYLDIRNAKVEAIKQATKRKILLFGSNNKA